MRSRFGVNVVIARSESYSVLTLNESIADQNDDNLGRIREIKVSYNLLIKIIIKILISFQKQLKKSSTRARASRFEQVGDDDRVVVREPAAIDQPIVELEVIVEPEISIIAVVAAKPKMVLKDCYVTLV